MHSRRIKEWRFGCVLCVMWQLTATAAWPQNPFETIGLGALTIASNVAEVLQNGAAARTAQSFGLPFMSANSTSELGLGRAIIQRNIGSDEDSDEDYRRRRKRAVAAPVQRRVKRAPCAKTTPSTGAGNETEVSARRAQRRARATQAPTAKKFIDMKTRRRRGTEQDELQKDVEAIDGRINEQVKRFTDGIRSLWDSFLGGMKEIAQKVQNTFSGSGGSE